MKYRIGMLLLASAVLGFGPGAERAGAQSAFATRGLGYPVDPQDARAAGLAGTAVGLTGMDVSWANPGAGFGLGSPTFIIAYQYDNYSAEREGRTFDGSTARFPLILGAFPIGERLALQAGFGSFLDQNWAILEPDTLLLGGDTIPVVDWFRSEGGVARVRLGAAYEVVDGLGLGLGLDLYTGGVSRLQGRAFPEDPVPVCCAAAWDYSGLGITAGLRWAPTLDSTLGASVTYGGTLDAAPTEAGGTPREYALPLTVRGGASGRIATNTLLAVGGNWTGWSDLDAELASDGGARNSWSAHGGIEYDGLVIRDRPIPLRSGGRIATLPFRWDATPGIEWAGERAFSLGAGVLLGGGAVQPDFSLEFGSRGGAATGIDESFWRAGFSMRVYGR